MEKCETGTDTWAAFTEAEAIEIAVERHGKDPATSVAFCALEACDEHRGPEYRFWFSLFLRLIKLDHIGWS